MADRRLSEEIRAFCRTHLHSLAHCSWADRAAALEKALAEACRDRDRYLDAIDEACKQASKKGCVAGIVLLADVPRGGVGEGGEQ